MEIWKPVRHYEGIYEISNESRIRRIQKAQGSRCGFLRFHVQSCGYLAVRLSCKGKTRLCLVHRLLAQAFLDLPDDKRFVPNHKNGIRTDNRLENLEVISRRENWRHGLEILKSFSITPRVLPEEKLPRFIEMRDLGYTYREIAEEMGIREGAAYYEATHPR